MQTLYTQLDANLVTLMKKTKLLVLDVDGVFSDGRIYLGNAGEELKAFHTRDGYGVKAIRQTGIDVAVITGRQSRIVTQRMQALKVPYVIQGCEDKQQALSELKNKLGLATDEVAAMGDDMPDMGMFSEAAIKIAVADAHPQIAQIASWQTTLPGGFGAIREVADSYLQLHGLLDTIQAASV